jgi:hypothetical protein
MVHHHISPKSVKKMQAMAAALLLAKANKKIDAVAAVTQKIEPERYPGERYDRARREWSNRRPSIW